MVYTPFSSHAPTGESQTRVVSPNDYSSQGRTIGFPTKFDLYVQKIPNADGSQSVVETRLVSDLVGSRLYLYHRPVVNANGTPTTITVSDGTVDTTATNAKQGYIVFSSLPVSTFTVSYVAAQTCDVTSTVNNLQDSVMEIEKTLGASAATGYPGLRNLKFGIFDSPADAITSGVAQNAVYLSHLDRDVTIASSDDAGLAILRGSQHTIQIGRETDRAVFDVTGFEIKQTDGALYNTISLGTKTGDNIYYKGRLSGAGPLTIGGPEWSNYSGIVFTSGLTGSFYSGSMLRVHGDVSVMGGIKSIGAIEVITTTGITSIVYGDWTIRDELFVHGISHLVGPTETNDLTVQRDLYVYKDIIAQDQAGSGGHGQTLMDGLDCSEIAHNYKVVTKRTLPNSIVSAPVIRTKESPKNLTYTPYFKLEGNKLVGDIFTITGQLNATAGPSGVHPHILQLLLNEPIVTGTLTSSSGVTSGTWSPGMMDPGSLWIKMMPGGANPTFTAPIYNYTVEQENGSTISRLNVFVPEYVSNPPQTNDPYMLFYPGAVSYRTISAAGGASPTFAVTGSVAEPLAVSFEDEVRILTAPTSNLSLSDALTKSTSGLSEPATGIAYIFADSNGVDPEDPPIFKARPVPYRMPGQTPIGEVVASVSGGTWTILESTSYRPGGTYDSAWIPIVNNDTITHTSGRCTPGFTKNATSPLRVYFHHRLGCDVEVARMSADLYLGKPAANTPIWNKTHAPVWSMFGQDIRNTHGLSGAFIHVPLGAQRIASAITERDASIFYMDGNLIGIDLSPDLLEGFPTGAAGTTNDMSYMRLVLRRDA